MTQSTWRLLAVVVLAVVLYFTLGGFLSLVLLVVLSIVYVRYTPHRRLERAQAARLHFYAQVNPIKHCLSSLKDARSNGNASRFYDIHRAAVASLPNAKENSNKALSTVNDYIAWHQKRFGKSLLGKETNHPIDSEKLQHDTKADVVGKLNDLKAELSYNTEVATIDPIPTEDVHFINNASSHINEVFEESLSDHSFAVIYEQQRTRRSMEHIAHAIGNEVSLANRRAARAESEAKKAHRKAGSAKRKADQAGPSS